MTEVYSSGTRSSRKPTRREWKAYIRQLKASYKKGDALKMKMKQEKQDDEEQAELDLAHDLELI